MRYNLDEQQCKNLQVSSRREWILTNGIGGYAMGSASGINTRRYHGQLVAAINPPTVRMVLLACMDAMVQIGGNPVGISANQYPGVVYPEGYLYLTGFKTNGQVATWQYRVSGADVEKSLAIHPNENAVTFVYRNTGKVPFTLTLRPLVSHKGYHENFTERPDYPHDIGFFPAETRIEDRLVTLYLAHPGGGRQPVQGWYYRFDHTRETERGLDPRDDLYCPCELTYDLAPGEFITLTAADQPRVVPIEIPQESGASEYRLTPFLTDSALPFLVKTEHRTSIIAGYPWFTDWGRDTMISLPGICLCTGRIAEARQILTDYAGQIHQGLLPNRFVDHGETPDTNTVDATLWFANAIYKTLLAQWDLPFADLMAKALEEVFVWHVKGTLFGIKVDPADGLLSQGAPGVQLTWMDAKVGDWVVTPRHGKPVEINGLWVNALCVMEWLEERRLGKANPRSKYAVAAKQAQESFNLKFWHEGRGHYLDTVDPDDASLRPNMIIALALPFLQANSEHAKRALEVAGRELLTPMGLRTLGPSEPNYRGRYSGSLPEMDAAYHQGTAWPWLLGSYATALVRYTGDRQEAKRILRTAKTMLSQYGLGGIAEVYDGDEPQGPGGCPWQAWSAAEILRAWVEDVGGD